MTPVHVITLPEQSGRELSLDKLCHLTAILRMRDTREEAEAMGWLCYHTHDSRSTQTGIMRQ